MHRFFIDQSTEVEATVIISGNDYNHLKNSLRLNIGDRVILSDGDGFDMEAEILKFHDQGAELKILSREKSKVEAETKVWLAQGLPKKSKMDLIVEKATEIGFAGLIPLESKRTIVKYDHKKKNKKQSRWQRVAEAAAKQSGRAVIPEIKDFYSSDNLKALKEEFDYVLLLWEDEKEYSIKEFFKENNIAAEARILLIIGPEGGFSATEVSEFKKDLNARIITLGPRILRTETAGITALTAILYEKGELGD
ncbi:16S rRNA (uracil1498-N3)-methyltransferase [Halanaerobium saccharolyticum]|uniref:Ribosomal RNA small subunit methyltransferase E n=1 Tax=Halanaerobium saccharolyticum TaxID=43595 RepID=A0A4R7Z4N1_9FIRM|nr:16S rRNA (uracil(1498)-N(3))-methyltransferase [Halanaerobium saccharolyticum]RAK10336.1 16S rRNA (uracil1498-N3)-methyltransferase [Halanaerobium saccharolyticum]TDW05282.1 16S rRNA (uracil1498-N3)-methyltransferase [Halanaerobium saccharolyticum]TDX60352.1 16S rRNA (uracil1498-N3)-methyltransferase [Halanaerobium saccharolyticum]